MNDKKEIDKGFFKIPRYFFDYGLQVFSPLEFDIICHILRNTIGNQKTEFTSCIKMISLIKHYSEKNIIKAINNLIMKTNVFDKDVYREKGSYIKKTRYYITENSVDILTNYVHKNLPSNFNEKIEIIKNRKIEAVDRLKKGRDNLLQKQQGTMALVKQENIVSIGKDSQDERQSGNEDDYRKSDGLLGCWREIINDYDPDECRFATFKEYKEDLYDFYFLYVPEETNDEKIDIRLSDLVRFTNDWKTIDFFTALIQKKKLTGKQSLYLLNSLKISFKFKTKNIDRINIIYE